MKKTKIIILCGILLFGVLYLLYFIYFATFSELEDKFKIKKIVGSNNEIIYLKKITRGLNYCRIIISKTNDRSSNYNNDYVCSTGYDLFYRFSNDTLYVYTDIELKEPLSFNSKITIIQKILSNSEIMELYSGQNKKGIEKF